MKNKRIFSRFLVPTLVVGIFGIMALSTNVLGEDASTTTDIDNVVPSFTSHTVESWTQTYVDSAVTTPHSDSSAANPTNEGTLITFTATADDTNKDNYYLIVCENAGVTANANAAPTCNTGSTVCTSASTADEGTATCTKDTTSVSAETVNWYSYVCDYNTNSLCSAASNTSQGGDHAEAGATPTPAGSPFHVNHIPTFTAGTPVDSGGNSIEPSDTVKFLNSVDADGDTNDVQDTINFYVCPAEAYNGGVTAKFDFQANECLDASDQPLTKICAAMAVDPSAVDNATCNDTQGITPIPTAHGDYAVKIYVEDQHSYAAAAGQPINYTVTDVAPSSPVYTTNDTVNLQVNTYDTLTRSVTYTDINGDRDVTALDMVFFLESLALGDGCSADENDCYRLDNINPLTLTADEPALGTEGCYTSTLSSAGTYSNQATGTDSTVTVSCNFIIWFNATPSADPTYWEVSATATDNLGDTNFADSTVNSSVNAISGIGVVQANINYGTLGVGDTSAVQSTTMENLGNTVIDVVLSGTDMASGGYSIDSTQQKWDHSGVDFNYASSLTAWPLLNLANDGCTLGSTCEDIHGCLNRNLDVRNNHDDGTTLGEDETLAWKILIPLTQESGAYTGLNTFTSTDIDDCTGEPDGIAI